MLSESLRVAYRADDAVGTILVGSVLTLLTGVLVAVWMVLLAVRPQVGLAATPVVALPSLVMRGYLLEVIEEGRRNEATVPSFVEWGSLARAGTKSVLVSVLYLLPGAVFCGVVVVGLTAATSLSAFDETAQALTGLLVVIAGVGLVVYGVVYLYVRPAVRAVFAATDSLRAALGVRRVLRVAASSEFLTGWLIATGLLAVGPTLLLPPLVVAALVGLLSPPVAAVIVLVTFILAVGLAFVVRVSAAWSSGRGAASGLDRLYPAAIRPAPASDALASDDMATDDSRIVVEAQATAEHNGRSAEVDPLVQIGRTVGASRIEQPTSEKPTSETADPGPTSNEATETVGQELAAAEQATETDNTAEPPLDEGVDEDDDSGFVWGLNDNESQ